MSEPHKKSIESKIRQADEQRKDASRREENVRKEIDSITRSAMSSMGLGSESRPSHPLMHGFEPSLSIPQKTSQWLTCRSENGSLYYANKVTGLSQWEKPIEFGPLAEPRPEVPAPKSSAPPPPRPKSAAPPPRPKASAPNRKHDIPKEAGDASLLASAFLPAEPEVVEGGITDATTGFGSWGVVQDSKIKLEDIDPREMSMNLIISKQPTPAFELSFMSEAGASSEFRRPAGAKRIKRRPIEDD